jgi:hypothetical protein
MNLFRVKCPACNLTNIVQEGEVWDCGACDGKWSWGETTRAMNPVPSTLQEISSYVANLDLKNQRLEAVRSAAESLAISAALYAMNTNNRPGAWKELVDFNDALAACKEKT